MDQEQIKKIKESVTDFFNRATISVLSVDIDLSPLIEERKEENDTMGKDKVVINLEVKLDEPQILIGQGGQTLFEIQHLLRMILNKKFHSSFGENKILYLNLDINDYKKKKTEYLKDLAKNFADQVSLNKEEKRLPPMSSYERKIIHAELSLRKDVTTESKGEGLNRHILIKPV
jgi:spoIIIJ-associated protein